jgi:folate-binding protein YgfZ
MTTRFVERPGHGAVSVHGADATTFLQSLVSQDLEVLADGDGTHSLLLSPQGKLEVDFRALRVGDGWWLDCDAGFGAELAERLGRYRIRVKVEIEDRSSSWDLLEIRGADAPARAGATLGVAVPDVAHAHVPWGACRVVRADWSTMPGVDVLGPSDEIHGLRDRLLGSGLEPFPPGTYEVARIEAGIPRLGVDIDERTIPQEALLERDAVSFTKGCFLGQELVCRIDTRGHVNRFLRRVDLAGVTVPETGASVSVDGKEVGTLTSIVPVPGEDRSVGFAMVRREVEPPADVVVSDAQGDLTASVSALP